MSPAHPGDAARVVIDTNVLISRFAVPHSVPAAAVRRASTMGRILLSPQLLDELIIVLARPKFRRYFTAVEQDLFLREFLLLVDWVETSSQVRVCRDAKDNRVLEAALDGYADCIITGDRDLLDLQSFHGIALVTPKQYLDC